MEKALNMAKCAEQQLRGDNAETALQRAILYNTYGVVALQHGDFDAAETWFRKTKSLRECHLSSAHVLVVGVTLNLILLLLNQMRAQEAVEELTQKGEAIDQDETLPVRYRSDVDDFLAEAHLLLSHYDTAWECLQRSIAMTRETVPLESQGSGYPFSTSILYESEPSICIKQRKAFGGKRTRLCRPNRKQCDRSKKPVAL
ncbi:hypothetical protein BKA56DRAFT_106799 [Ilyonectria sp. MPI-CAGE-AT-0026]|nr:hypothetical protein BKA56DRAFT_106799 [Ilyonectria sp. MPI-CAGE-AT-0026]